MHGCGHVNAPLVNAEVDSMGGVIDSGVGIGIRSTPLRAAIEKAQAELRLEYDAREERKRELEFLENGGNPLDFKFGNAASVSVQSTSLTDRPPEQLLTSEAKGSFALTTSPHGDSVESSGRPDAPVVSEPNCADNLLLSDGENGSADGRRNSVRFVPNKIALSEQTSQLDGSQNAKESGESGVFGLPKSQAYKRRNRSRPNREGGRSSSTNIVPSRGDHVSSLPSCSGQQEVKGSVLDTDNQKNCYLKPSISNFNMAPYDLPSNGVVNMVLDNGQAVESNIAPIEVGLPKLVLNCAKDLVASQRSEDVGEEPSEVRCEIPDSVDGKQLVVSPCVDCSPLDSAKPDNQAGSAQKNGLSDAKGDGGKVPDEGQNCSTTLTIKSLDSEFYCTRNSLGLDRTPDSIPSNGLRNEDFKENTREEILICSVAPNLESDEKLKAKNENKTDDRCSPAQDEHSSISESNCRDFSPKSEEELHESRLHEEVKHIISVEGMKVDGITALEIEGKLDDLDPAKENVSSGRLGGSTDESAHDNRCTEKENAFNRIQDPSVPGLLSETAFPSRDSSDTNKHKISTETQMKLEVRTHENSILKEARFIEAKRKRISQLAVGAFAFENRQKSHWDFVLEEMAWLANDFAQERLWKVSAAAQLSHQIASTSRERLAEKSSLWKQKKVAHTLSKAIMEFWLSAEELGQGTTMQCPGRNSGVHEYAARYVKNDTSRVSLRLAEAPVTPERISDLGSQELRLEEQLTDDNLFYTVPPGAMEAYRKDGESHLAQVEKTSGSIQEEVETSVYDAAADLVSQGNAYEKDEGETNTYLLSGDTESGKPSKFALKKRILIKSSSARSCDMGADSSFVQCMENKFGTLQSGQTAKRPVNNLRVSANPPKRMRTASRPRFTPPFTAGTSGGIQVPNKTDGSSGDTNSFQDNQSTFHGISQNPNSMEVESVADFERQLPFDSAEVSKPKKKKPKHLGSTNEHRWRLENKFQNEPGGYSRKRFDKFVESNGSSGLSGQHVMKKQKLMRQPMNNSIDNYSPLVGSIPSSVTSQMSNMSNSKKLVKILGGRDHGRKSKSLKMPVGQIGPGSPWSSFEEQALIVLVHDLGPNWELISDAINSILQYKCIFRKPKECSEHHKELISRTVGDGADSAEDSGSSQPYPSTLPGIPKGSARALFQRLQEPIEEDMIKFHFEKIIVMSQQEHYRKMQNENQDQKPIQPHSSHALALSQVCPNNINGGPVLTPLDLCDTTDPSPDVLSGGYQGTHGGGLSVSNQGGAASLPSTSAANSSARGSPNTVHGKSFSTPSHPLSSLMRDGRFSGPRSASLSVDEHQRVQQYNQMMPGRVYGTPLGTGRGGRLMAGGNGMGVMSGLNRNMTITRPGFPGIAPSSDPNSGSMLPSNMAVMTGPGNMHSGVGAGSGNSMLRSRDSLNMIRPGQIPDHQRQMMAPDLQMPAVQGNIQGAAPFGGLSSGLSNQTSPPSSQTHHFHHQQQHPSSPQQSHVHNNPHHPHLQDPNHVSSSQHQARVFRFAKERQLKLQEQHLLPQRQLAASGDMMPSGPPEPQGFVQNNSHVQPQSSASVSATLTPSSSMPPMSQNQLKPHMPPNGLARNQQSGANQTGKQRQRQSQQQLQNSNPQTGRQHPQQWAHPQLHAKLVKGAGRVNMAIHQTSSVDSSILNGLCPTTGSQSTEKAERIINTMQGQGLYPGSGLNPRLPSNQRLIQERKLYSGQAIASSKQVQLPKHLDNNALGQASPSISGNALPTSRQATSPSFTSSKSQLMQPSLKLANTSQPPVQRVLQHNHQSSTDSLPSKLLADQDQSEQQHLSSSSSPPQLGTSAVHHEPYVEQVSVEHVVSTSGTQWREAEQMQSLIVPKPAVQSAPVGSPLTSLHRTQSQGSAEGQVSVSLPPKGLDTGTQRHPRQPQLQTSSSPPQQKQQPVPAQQLQAGNSNFYANARSADNRLE